MSGPCYPSQLKEVKFSRQELAWLWEHMKANYFEKGVKSYERALDGTGRDLGLNPAWIDHGFRNNRATRQITNEMYRRMSDTAHSINQAKDYVRDLDKPLLSKAVNALFKIPFAVAVAGHGTVGMETHAGGRMFLPTTWNSYWPNFFRQWKLWLNKGYHQAMMLDLKHSQDFDLFRRAGSAIDPGRVYTDYGMIARFAGLRGGQRGFDSLKLYRKAAMDASWAKVPASIKTDPVAALEMARGIADIHNAATGTVDIGSGPAANIAQTSLFAAKLLASRWKRVIGDPLTTIGTWGNWKHASAAEQFQARTRTKNAAWFTGTYVGAMLANQGLLNYLGSNQKVNFTDPSQSDWLKFKAFGKTIALDGNLLDPVRLLGQIIYGDLIKERTRYQERQGTRRSQVGEHLWKYVQGKLTPTLGIVTDLTTGTDYQGRPVPRPFLPTEKPKYKDQPAYTPSEYILAHGPIPLSGGIREIYDDFREQGMTAMDATSFIRALAGMGFQEWAKAGATTLSETTGSKVTKDYRAEHADAPLVPY